MSSPIDEIRARQAACSTFVHGDGYVRPADQLALIGDEVAADIYGEGGVVAELEAHVASLLGAEAAVFLPSGTMAQAATLRVHADVRPSRTVLWHPLCHLAVHENEGYARLHRLVGRAVGSVEELITLDDLGSVAEPVAALLLELPQRDLGGRLPAWDDLVAQVGWARDRGAAAHLDGARLWEASAGYDRPPSEIAALFDTTYVSFYKGIGALPGCCVAGTRDVVDQVREWRQRMGGSLYGLWPAAASALRLLPERLAEMPARLAHARAIAERLAELDAVTVLPDPPQTPLMHLLLRVDEERYRANARRLEEEEHVWTWPGAMTTGDPSTVRVEFVVGRATCELTSERVAELVGALVV